MAIRFTYSIKVAFDDDQIEAIRTEAAKRAPALEAKTGEKFDLTDLRDCARILFGDQDPMDGILGELDFVEWSDGVVGVEVGVPFENSVLNRK